MTKNKPNYIIVPAEVLSCAVNSVAVMQWLSNNVYCRIDKVNQSVHINLLAENIAVLARERTSVPDRRVLVFLGQPTV